jgi:hypothetical protein
MTALMFSARAGHINMAAELVRLGADLDTENYVMRAPASSPCVGCRHMLTRHLGGYARVSQAGHSVMATARALGKTALVDALLRAAVRRAELAASFLAPAHAHFDCRRTVAWRSSQQ